MHNTIRPAQPGDAAAIAAIYNPYVLETCISFEEQPVGAEEIAARLARTVGAGLPWLVIEADGELLGYAYASKWRERAAYRHSVETSVYLAPAAHGRGLGRQLYTALLERLRALGMHCAIGGIAQPNPASVALHESLGFVQVALFKEVGFKAGDWRDVGYWQLQLQPKENPDA
ncbi:arsinothricin resistance N-acetyltransferase ArsN1 family B [Massilia sp. TS11]|uniref:arsinothricin resistance N-acetyltransferase ArsN1 family B n=1 Tax=Massilia sp. TS11 TaxID=2908003 RepID=UPI001EDC32BA|nr:arsinothricin resistance N-acetyltransferase ArsN1 family B [Massilia sp. TS11]MCG2585625.1 N-acetyltransferase family protein [Massilia sp. TS11]